MSRAPDVNNNPFGPPSPVIAIPTLTQQPSKPTTNITNPFDTADSKYNGRRLLEGITLSANQEIICTDNNEDTTYKYNGNHSRGAIMLNDYDWNRKGSRLHYDYKKVDAELPKYLLFFRKGLYVVQMLILAGAIIQAIGAYIAESNSWAFAPYGVLYGNMELEVIFLPYCTAGLCFITAIVGFIGAKTHEKCGRIMLIVFLILIAICLILSIASTAQAFADMGNRFHYAERQWDALTREEEKTFEYHMYCCNFDEIEPCCRFGYGVADCVNEYFCFEKVEPHLIEQFTIIGVTSGLQTFNLLCITICAGILYCYLAYKEYKKKKEMTENQQTNNKIQRIKYQQKHGMTQMEGMMQRER